MALKAIVDSLDNVPESVKGEYVPGTDENEGKFVLNVESVNGFQLAPITKLQNALSAARQERDTFKDQLKSFRDDEGNLLDLGSMQSELEDLRKLKDLDPKDSERIKTLEENLKKQYAAREEQLTSNLTAKLKEAEEKANKFKSQLHKSALMAEATKAIEEHGGYSEVLLPHVERFCKAEEIEDSEGNVRIKYNVIDPETGQPRLSVANPGSTENMSVSELVAELKKTPSFQGCFKAPDTSGSGSGNRKPQNGNPLPQSTPAGDDVSNPVERLKQARMQQG